MLSVIIPTYNEKENIGRLIPELFVVLSKHKIKAEAIVVDDSTDGTGEVAKKLAKKYNVRVLIRKNKKGLSSAVVDGFAMARGEYLCVIDADFSHPLGKIPEMYKALDIYDFVVGSRYVKGGGISKWPLRRRLVSAVATCLARPLTPIKDPVSGFFALRRNVIKGVRLDTRGYKIGLEVVIKGNYTNFKEIPYVFVDRKKGSSKMGIQVVMNYIVHILGLYRYGAKRTLKL